MKRRRRNRARPQGLVEVSQLLEGALKVLGVRGDWDRHRLEGKCRERLGDAAAALTQVEEKEGVVTLYFSHGAFLQEMAFRREEILEGLKADLPSMRLKEVRAALSRPRGGRT